MDASSSSHRLPQALAMAASSSHRHLIAVAQMTSTSDIAQNRVAVEAAAAEAAGRRASILFLPECFAFLGDSTTSSSDIAEDLDGPLLQTYREMARRHGIWMSLGGFPERAGAPSSSSSLPSSLPSSKVFNTHVIVDPSGSIVAAYRKVHMFDVSGPGLPTLQESAFTEAGAELVAVDTPVGRLGLSTCYDVRFPRLYSELAAAGATVLAVPSAFTVPTGAAHWEPLLRARAIETQCYVVAAAQTGKHNESPGRTSWGHAMVVDPWGAVVAQASEGATSPSSPTVIFAEIDPELIASVRAKMPVASHARAHVYEKGARVVMSGTGSHA